MYVFGQILLAREAFATAGTGEALELQVNRLDVAFQVEPGAEFFSAVVVHAAVVRDFQDFVGIHLSSGFPMKV